MAIIVADAILHPVRMRILMTLSGRHLTTQEIGAALPDVAQATLYRHLSRLTNAGAVTVIARRPVRGVLEKTYALVGDGLSLMPDVGGMSASEWERAFAAFTASLLGQFGVYLRQEPINPAADGISFRTAPLYLSDAELVQILTGLRAVLAPALAHGPGPGRRRRLLSTIVIPDAEPGAEGKIP